MFWPTAAQPIEGLPSGLPARGVGGYADAVPGRRRSARPAAVGAPTRALPEIEGTTATSVVGFIAEQGALTKEVGNTFRKQTGMHFADFGNLGENSTTGAHGDEGGAHRARRDLPRGVQRRHRRVQPLNLPQVDGRGHRPIRGPDQENDAMP